MISEVVYLIVWYSTSALEWETAGCFFEIHVTRFPLRNMHVPWPIDKHLGPHPNLIELLKQEILLGIFELCLKTKPLHVDLLAYQYARLLWDDLFLDFEEIVRLDLLSNWYQGVLVRYWRHPTICRYSVTFSIKVPSFLLNLGAYTTGVVHDFDSDMLNCNSKSITIFYCVRVCAII